MPFLFEFFNLDDAKPELSTLIHSWWFDPFIASFTFFVFIMFYSHFELLEGKSCYKNWSEYLWGKGVDGTDTRRSMTMSLIVYWIGIIIWVKIVPPAAGVGLKDTSVSDYDKNNRVDVLDCSKIQSLSYLCMEVSSGIFLYDTVFFLIHFGMHEFKYLSFLSHEEHHKARNNLEARHVLRHSVLDGALQVLVNIAVQRNNVWGSVKSRLARTLHNIIVTAMLTESHCACSYPNIFRRWCVGVREHRSHHLCVGEYIEGHGLFHRYQQFFSHWDNMRLWYLQRKARFKME
mmetsp:Transcript_15308/g.17819  ORF Transcript_15308/g.17819 Transcript_15308/m.17819 type:complete len:289 (+) Transcript_15308:91-957(+)